MEFDLTNIPANRAYDVFRSLFATVEDFGMWMWKHKHTITVDCEYHDGTDGSTKQYVERIQTDDPHSGQITVFDGMPSAVAVYGIGTQQERALITWYSSGGTQNGAAGELKPPEVRVFERTPDDYKAWAKANGIRSRMPILKK